MRTILLSASKLLRSQSNAHTSASSCLEHAISPHRYACNSMCNWQAHFMLKLVSSILMGMRPFAKPLRWRSSSSSVTSKNLICTSERGLSTACEQSDGMRETSEPLRALGTPPAFQQFQVHTSAVAKYIVHWWDAADEHGRPSTACITRATQRLCESADICEEPDRGVVLVRSAARLRHVMPISD